MQQSAEMESLIPAIPRDDTVAALDSLQLTEPHVQQVMSSSQALAENLQHQNVPANSAVRRRVSRSKPAKEKNFTPDQETFICQEVLMVYKED
jgi:hypothetical protein